MHVTNPYAVKYDEYGFKNKGSLNTLVAISKRHRITKHQTSAHNQLSANYLLGMI